jgi:hypothetical protein
MNDQTLGLGWDDSDGWGRGSTIIFLLLSALGWLPVVVRFLFSLAADREAHR